MTDAMTGCKKGRILLIVKGKKREPELFEHVFSVLGLNDEPDIFPVGTTIHAFFEYLTSEYDDGLDNPDLESALIDFLASRCPRSQEHINELATLQAGHYTDVALIFDFDPQDNRFDPLLLKKLQSVYNESTELGQLYINYPMLESYCDFRYLGDYSFLDETVELGDVKGSAYKELVASKNQSMVNIKQLNGKTVAAILAMHISKIQYLIEGVNKRAIVFESCKHVGSLCNQAYSCDLEKVLNYECGLLNEMGEVATINTCLLFFTAWEKHLDGCWRNYCNQDR